MMSIKKTILLLMSLIIFFISTLSSCRTVDLLAYETSATEKSLHRGKEILHTTHDDITVAVGASWEGDENRFSIVVENNSNKKIFINDHNIQVYQGNVEKEKWEKLYTYKSREYYAKVRKEINTTAVLMAVAGALNSVNAGYSKSRTTGTFNSWQYGISGTYSSTTTTYNPSQAYATLALHEAQLKSYLSQGKSRLELLEQSLLYPSELPSGKNYWGLVFTKEGKGPDYRFDIKIEGKVYSYYFLRSDRNKVIHPFSDAEYPQHSLFYSYSLYRPYGLNYSYNSNKGIGFFAGFSMELPEYGGWDEPSYETVDEDGNVDGVGDYVLTGDETTLETELSFGLNYKLFSHTWVKLGIGINMINNYYLADHYYSTGKYWDTGWIENESPDFEFNPRIGVDLIFGPIFLSPSFVLDGLSDPSFEIGGGIAF